MTTAAGCCCSVPYSQHSQVTAGHTPDMLSRAGLLLLMHKFSQFSCAPGASALHLAHPHWDSDHALASNDDAASRVNSNVVTQ